MDHKKSTRTHRTKAIREQAGAEEETDIQNSRSKATLDKSGTDHELSQVRGIYFKAHGDIVLRILTF
jgi:hypothetical protein